MKWPHPAVLGLLVFWSVVWGVCIAEKPDGTHIFLSGWLVQTAIYCCMEYVLKYDDSA